ncbi:MAG: PAN domain-containing protein, partial [Pyrinomonadaceae bacterium]|nr:PAN domain-containing protein [Pyrinomonadaceae bacterium]
MKKKIIRLAILSLTIVVVLVAVGTFFLSSDIKVSGQEKKSKGWRVWVREEPCAGRFDWLSVAREQQGGGKNFYVPYETVLAAGGKCTRSEPDGCTFAEATALMEELRGNDKFFDYCCRDYSVWTKDQTKETSVFLIRTGTPGLGWRFEKGDLCCEEAEKLAGKPGACSGGSKTGGGSGWGPIQQGSINQGDGQSLTYYRGTTPEQCQADCDKNPKCVAFTLIKAGAYSPNDPPMCYLMSEAKKVTPSSCCITGIKNKGGGGDKCSCKESCPDCAGLP